VFIDLRFARERLLNSLFESGDARFGCFCLTAHILEVLDARRQDVEAPQKLDRPALAFFHRRIDLGNLRDVRLGQSDERLQRLPHIVCARDLRVEILRDRDRLRVTSIHQLSEESHAWFL
jgi:hypothetical protein